MEPASAMECLLWVAPPILIGSFIIGGIAGWQNGRDRRHPRSASKQHHRDGRKYRVVALAEREAIRKKKTEAFYDYYGRGVYDPSKGDK